MSENRGTNRPSHKADEIGAEGRERGRQRVFVGKEDLAED
jgi:hypothetical protein